MAKQLKDNVWIRLPKQVTFQFLTKCCEEEVAGRKLREAV